MVAAEVCLAGGRLCTNPLVALPNWLTRGLYLERLAVCKEPNRRTGGPL
jgi:hypothetical protein